MTKENLKYTTLDGEPIVIALTRSAPIQIKPFPGIQQLTEHWKSKGYKTLIDIGCGRLRNALFLVKYFKIWICDFPTLFQESTTKKRFDKLKKHKNYKGLIHPKELATKNLQADAAVLAFVLHTLPEERLRVRLVKNAKMNTISPHEIFVAIPNCEYYYRQRMKKDNQFGDGYVFNVGAGNHTFYREYAAREIDEFMQGLGFKVDKLFVADKKNQRTYVLKSKSRR